MAVTHPIVTSVPTHGLHIHPTQRAALVAKLQSQGKSPMPAAPRAIAPAVTKMSPREALSQGLVTSAREPTAEQKLLNAAAWLAEVSQDFALAKRLWDRGADVLPMQKASGELVNSTGGAIVPSQVAATIMAFCDKAVFRSNASTYVMSSDVLNVPRRTGGMTANFINESAVMPESAPTWDLVGLTAKKIARFGRFSSELDDDAVLDVTRYWLQDAGSSLGLKEDQCGWSGDGTSQYGGIQGVLPALVDGNHNAGKVAAASTHKTFQLLDLNDVQGLMAALPERYWPNAKFYCSAYAAANLFARLGASNGGFQVSGFGPNRTMSYCGVEIVTQPIFPRRR